MTVQYPHVEVRLTGRDGNAQAIVGAVALALRREVGPAASAAWVAEAWSSGDYDALLRLAIATVDVS